MNIALVLSGGKGRRLGTDIPKQYLEAGGRPVISYCLETLSCHERIDGIQIVAEPVWQRCILGCAGAVAGNEKASGKERIAEKEWFVKKKWSVEKNRIAEKFREKFRGFSLPGENRQLSIFHGLADIRRYGGAADCVLVHDAARPFISAELITECLTAVKGHDGVLPVLPLKDTVYVSEDGRRVSALLKRSSIFAGQAPELFRLGKYYEANRSLLPEMILEISGSAEPAIMAGMDIVMIPGDERNFKITTKEDLERFQEMVGKGDVARLDKARKLQDCNHAP